MILYIIGVHYLGCITEYLSYKTELPLHIEATVVTSFLIPCQHYKQETPHHRNRISGVVITASHHNSHTFHNNPGHYAQASMNSDSQNLRHQGHGHSSERVHGISPMIKKKKKTTGKCECICVCVCWFGIKVSFLLLTCTYTPTYTYICI